MAKHSKAFLKVFGDSMNATAGKSAEHYAQKRVRTGKTSRDNKAK